MLNSQLIGLQMQQANDNIDTNVIDVPDFEETEVTAELTGCVENYDGEFQNQDDWEEDYDH